MSDNKFSLVRETKPLTEAQACLREIQMRSSLWFPPKLKPEDLKIGWLRISMGERG